MKQKKIAKKKLLGVLMALPLVLFIYYPLVSKYGPIAIYLSIAIIALVVLAANGVVMFFGWNDKEDKESQSTDKIVEYEPLRKKFNIDLMHFTFEEIKSLDWQEVKESIEEAEITGNVHNRLRMIINFGKLLEKQLPENSHDA